MQPLRDFCIYVTMSEIIDKNYAYGLIKSKILNEQHLFSTQNSITCRWTINEYEMYLNELLKTLKLNKMTKSFTI